MSVILEFSIRGEDFQLGRVLLGPPTMRCELERIIPTGNMVMPFVWVTGDGHEAFRATVQANPSVQSLELLDRIDDSELYRIKWSTAPTDLIEGIAETDTVVLQAHGDGEWVFRLRFPDHNELSDFHSYVINKGIPIDIQRTYTLTEQTEYGYRFNLSEEQCEALVLALKEGYFETPSEAGLDELADKLDISRQALSNRIRRGNKKILRGVLLSSVPENN